MWFGIYGSELVHWKRTKLHGQKHRRAQWNQDAVLWRLHGLFVHDLDSLVHPVDVRLLPGVAVLCVRAT